MARTALTKTDAPGGYASAGTELIMAAADTTDQNKFVAGGRDLIVAHNKGTAATVTITSTLSPYNRLGHITTHSVGAGEIHVFGPFPTKGWAQTDGSVHLEASSADVEFGILKL